uniref:Uncharacterized protein n=1 Tax=Nelumbo nucifera TaxID=4432 RepID=A0A822ZJS3_NELNU|nr:TPA_asm: hypothetical protein HUJ06_002081 [Nelumbo nucifera]
MEALIVIPPSVGSKEPKRMKRVVYNERKIEIKRVLMSVIRSRDSDLLLVTSI